MTTSYSAEYKAAVAMSEETAIRTISRKLSLTALICDGVIAVYSLMWLCFFCNFLRYVHSNISAISPYPASTFTSRK